MNKTQETIAKRYSRHGEKWTETEVLRLKELYPKYSSTYISRKFSRTEGSILTHAQLLGLKKNREKRSEFKLSYRLWTKKEIDFLKKHYNKKTYNEIADAIGRTITSIGGKARGIGLNKRAKGRQWSKSELKYLINNYSKKTTTELAQKLKHPAGSIRDKAQQLKLKSGYQLNEKEQQYIKKWFPRKSATQISKILNCSIGAITGYAVRFGLHKIKHKEKAKYWSLEDIGTLTKLCRQGIAYSKIGNLLCRSLGAIDHQVDRFGLRKKRRKV